MCFFVKFFRVNWMGYLEFFDFQRFVTGDCRCYIVMVLLIEGFISSVFLRDTISVDRFQGAVKGSRGQGQFQGVVYYRKEIFSKGF